MDDSWLVLVVGCVLTALGTIAATLLVFGLLRWAIKHDYPFSFNWTVAFAIVCILGLPIGIVLIDDTLQPPGQ